MIKGFGGIFWRTKNQDLIKSWYSQVLKIDIEDWNGTVIKNQEGSETVFSFFSENDGYFPADQQVMLNFQVHSCIVWMIRYSILKDWCTSCKKS